MSILWVFAILGTVLAAGAVRAYFVERREGLARSKLRSAAAPPIALALIALAWFAPSADPAVPASLPAPAPAPAPTAPPRAPVQVDRAPSTEVAALRDKLKQLEERRKVLAQEIDQTRGLLEKLGPTEPAPDPGAPAARAPVAPPPPRAAVAPPAWPLYAAVALVIAGFILMFLGDSSSILPRRRPPPSTVADAGGAPLVTVTRMAEQASAGRWADALATAAQIQIEQLPKLDVLDFLFVRALCSVMSALPVKTTEAPSRARRAELLAAASTDLARVLELAPHMAEAMWLHGHVKAQQASWQDALALYRQARPQLEDLPFDHNESVCLLHLAEQAMARADNEAATQLFDEVARLGVLAGHIPVVMVIHRILAVRAQIKSGKLGAASEAIERIRQVEGLDDSARRAVTAACDVYELAIRYRAGKLVEALEAGTALLARWQPDKLPAIEDQVADEFLHPAVDRAALRMPPELYRALYFFEAVVRIEIAARAARPLDAETVDVIAIALLRALQFEPRHREVLAALAALYLAYRKDRTDRALDWLESALSLGVRSRAAQTLFLDARRAENERKELLAAFRTASTRFLSDPALGPQVRGALIEELGRFHEFRPIVLELQDSGALDLPAPTEVTIGGLHERAAFVAGVAAEMLPRLNGTASRRLLELHHELDALAANVDSSAKRIAALERAVMEQLGQLILR